MMSQRTAADHRREAQGHNSRDADIDDGLVEDDLGGPAESDYHGEIRRDDI